MDVQRRDDRFLDELSRCYEEIADLKAIILIMEASVNVNA